MIKYSHMLDIAFKIISEEEDGSDITPEQIHVAIAKRLVALAEAKELNIISGAIGICDTYEIEEEDGTREHWNANKAADTTDEWLLGERPMSNIIEKNGMAALLEELLEKTRQEIVDQECMIAKNIHPINFKPSLPKLEQILEQALIDERGQDDE